MRVTSATEHTNSRNEVQSKSRQPLVLLGAGTFFAALLTWTIVAPAISRTSLRIDFSLSIIAALGASYFAFTVKRPRGRSKTVWQLLGYGALAWVVAEIPFGYDNAIRFTFPNNLWIAYVIDLGAAIAAFVAIALLREHHRLTTEVFREVCDTLVVAGSLFLTAWIAGLDSPAAQHFTASVLLLDWLPFLGAIALTTLMTLVVLQVRDTTKTGIFVLALGLVGLAVGSAGFGYAGVMHLSYSPLSTDVGHVGAFLCLAIASRFPIVSAPDRQQRTTPSWWQLAIPYVFVLPTALVVAIYQLKSPHIHPVILAFATVILAAIAARQSADISDNRGLTIDYRSRGNLLANRAFRDPLTGLHNRAFLDNELRERESQRGPGQSMSLMLLDLDRFKRVNDTHGHPVGDELLKVVATRLLQSVRTGDQVVRTGGDEFAIVFTDAASSDVLAQIAQQIVDALTEPVMTSGIELSVGTSVGIAMTANAAFSSEELMREADIALYTAKRNGGNGYSFYEERLAEHFHAQLDLEHELVRGLANDQFFLAYQPIIDMQSGRPVGAEALIRWQHPERGVLLPASFLGVAEETGVIVPLGKWVLTQALRQTKKWRATLPGGHALWIAINVSSRQIQHGDLGHTLAEELRASGMGHDALHVELTESLLVEENSDTRALLTSTQDLGINLSLDDFGTGFSSLSYLQQLPINTLKIDQSFVAPIGREGAELFTVEAMVDLARALNIHVVAEGIETDVQLSHLRALGCEYGQGHLWSTALDADDFETWWVKSKFAWLQ